MRLDLRTLAIAASFILASIAVAAAANTSERPAAAAGAATEAAADARPIRVILPALWEAAPTSSGPAKVVRK